MLKMVFGGLPGYMQPQIHRASARTFCDGLSYTSASLSLVGESFFPRIRTGGLGRVTAHDATVLGGLIHKRVTVPLEF